MSSRDPFLSNFEPIIINESNLNTGIVNKEHLLIYSNHYWHKVYVQNALNYSRDFVLKTLMTTVHPLDFIPLSYGIEGEYVTFLLKNCGAAISELCRRNLTIAHPDSERRLPAFKIAIILKHSQASELKIEIQRNISSLLRKRYNSLTKTLNLEAFVRDPDLDEFCPLSQPKLMYFVLHLSKELEIVHLKLGNNEIELLKPLEALCGGKNLKGLSIIDFRRNNIKTLEYFSILKTFPITEIVLEGNPVCENISEEDYVRLIREHFPKVRRIDGCSIPTGAIVSTKQNFVCSNLGYNFVDQFLEHFFSLYDSDNRVLLESCYHRDALFSITSHYVSGYNTMPNSRLYDYKKYSRNLLTISDLSKADEGLFCGSSAIGRFFASLPKCEHDPYTFTVDLNKFSDSGAILSVSGIFKEPGDSLLESDAYFAFFRTFVLSSSGGIEFKINNDMLHISNVTNMQQSNAFKIVRIPKPMCNAIPVPSTQSEQNQIINCLVSLSSLKLAWARKCLEECDFNLKRALVLFMNLLHENRFPAEAFDFKDDFDISQVINAMKDVPMEESPPKTHHVEKSIPLVNQQKGVNQSQNVTKALTKDIAKKDNEKEFFSSPLIMSALSLPLNTPIDQARASLMKAKSIILTRPTTTIRIHKSLAKKFYKFRLFVEARKFLTEIMSDLPKPLGEELYSNFTLFEIQFGDLAVAKSMVLNTAETYPVYKTVKFIGEHVRKIHPSFSKKMFEAILTSNFPRDKKDAFKKGYELFLNKNPEFNQKEVFEGNRANAGIKVSTDPVLPKQNINIFQNNTNIKRNPLIAQNTTTTSAIPNTSNVVAVSDVRLTTCVEDQQMNFNDPGSKLFSFKEYRRKLLEATKCILAEKIHVPQLQRLLKMKSIKAQPIPLTNKIFGTHKNDVYVVKTLCAKLWELGLAKKATECLKITRKILKNNPHINAVGTHFKVLSDLENGRPLQAVLNVINFLKNCKKPIHAIAYFEELLTLKHEYIEHVFKGCSNSPEVNGYVKGMITNLYKEYCLSVGSTAADEMYDGLNQTRGFHPELIIPTPAVESLRLRLQNVPKHETIAAISEFVRENSGSLAAHIEATKQLFMLGFDERARDLINGATHFNEDDTLTYTFAYIYYEIKYGSTLIATDALNRIDNNYSLVNKYFLLITCHVAERDFENAADLFSKAIARECMKLVNPLLLRVQYQYYKDWLANGFELFSMAKFN